MRLGQYVVNSDVDVTAGKPFLASRDEAIYLVRPCDTSLYFRQQNAIDKVLSPAVRKGGSISIPEIFRVGGNNYTADLCGADELSEFPAKAICCLKAGHRRRLILSAVSELALLEENGIIHGNIDLNAFCLDAARDGTLFLRMMKLENMGQVNRFAAVRQGDEDYRAPEAVEMAASFTPAEDVFSLGVCMHVWLTGCLPRREDVSPRQILRLSDQVPAALRPVIAMMLSPQPQSRPRASALIQLLSGEVRVKSAWDIALFHGDRTTAEYARIVNDTLAARDQRFDPAFMEKEALAMGW